MVEALHAFAIWGKLRALGGMEDRMGMSDTRQGDCSPDPHTDAQQGRYGGYLQGFESGRGDEGGLMCWGDGARAEVGFPDKTSRTA